MITISCKGIKKSYGEDGNTIEALKGIDLDIAEGQLTLLVGPSGSGKSTLLSIIHTILTPDEGSLTILGCAMNGLSERERASFRSQYIGVIFQALHLIPTLTVLENVTLPMIIQSARQDEAEQKAVDILKQLNLDNRVDSIPTHLSRGQQQRVAIARALVNNPKIVMCDEPTSALDQKAGFEFMSILKDLALHEQRTVFVITHDQRIFPFSDRIIHLSDGLIQESHA